jgi:hypothetical protein
MDASAIRKIVAGLEGAAEEPHHHLVSFRINGRIFATMPGDGSFLNIFVDEAAREKMLGMYPDSYEKVWWGKNVMGIRALPGKAHPKDIAALLATAYQQKASA